MNDFNPKRRRTSCYDGGYTKESGGIPPCSIAKGNGATLFTGLHRTLHKILPYVVCPNALLFFTYSSSMYSKRSPG